MKLTQHPSHFLAYEQDRRGPLTMVRLKFHPRQDMLLAQVVDRRLLVFDPAAEPEEVPKKKEKSVLGRFLVGHREGWIRGLDLSPDGASLATVGSDRRLCLWPFQPDTYTEEPQRETAAHEAWAEAVAYAPHGRTIATLGSDRTVKLWNASDLRLLATQPAHENNGRDLAWTADGSRIYTCSEDGRVLGFHGESLALEQTIEFGFANDQQGQNPAISGAHRLALSHDSRWLAVAGHERVTVFDTSSGEAVAVEKLRLQAVWHPTAPVLAAGNGEMKVWECEPGKFAPAEPDKNGRPRDPAAIPGQSLGSYKLDEYALGLAFSRDGRLLAAGRGDGSISMCQVET